ncbi:hypothetical protein V8C86DRAFT_2474351 [Haematococcus lacustris]|nr:hypothetical protein QJQ45_027288 [Haematococcus lacustris]
MSRAALALTLALTLLFTECWAAQDIKLAWAKDRWCNPSLVEYHGDHISAAKTTDFKRKRETTWWINSLFLCSGRSSSNLSCTPFHPWRSRFSECTFDKRVRAGKVDVAGLGDVKLWVWPGKGVYAIFGRKPQRSSKSHSCTELIVYHQWLAQVRADPLLPASDPWNLAARDPLALIPTGSNHTYSKDATFVMEKNWMPFVYKDVASQEEQLLVTYMVHPHMIYQLHPNGSATHMWTTRNNTLMQRFQRFDVHGGPPIVYVPPHLARGSAYYLGIMHHIERFDGGRTRLYRHFAYKTATQPPFAIQAISDELPLVYNQTYTVRSAFVAFVTGLHVSTEGVVSITYGSADIESRLLTMTVTELESLFTGNVYFRPINVAASLAAVNAAVSPAARRGLLQAATVTSEGPEYGV